MEFKVGDWVKQYRKGYYQIVGFFDFYHDMESDEKYISGQFIQTIAQLKKGFTETGKYSLAVDCCAVSLLKSINSETLEYINNYFADNPQQFEEFKNNKVAEKIGINTFYIYLTNEQKILWENELLKLPKRFTAIQFHGFCRKKYALINGKKNKKEKNNKPYVVTCEFCEETVELGKIPMYHKPILIPEK